ITCPVICTFLYKYSSGGTTRCGTGALTCARAPAAMNANTAESSAKRTSHLKEETIAQIASRAAALVQSAAARCKWAESRIPEANATATMASGARAEEEGEGAFIRGSGRSELDDCTRMGAVFRQRLAPFVVHSAARRG